MKEETALRGRLQKSVVDIVASRSRRLMVDVGHSRLGGGLWPLDPSWSRAMGKLVIPAAHGTPAAQCPVGRGLRTP